MKALVSVWLLCILLCAPAYAGAQTPVGALAIDERQGDQYGWAVDYETVAAAQGRALRECGAGCSVVLTFGRCAAYAADRDAGSTAVGWAESYGSAAGARQAALSECRSRGGGSGCIVRVWGCNGPVVEEGLGLDRAARRQIQERLETTGFDPGGVDGLFGPRTRAAIRRWQESRGVRPTGYLDGASAASLRSSVAGQPTFRDRAGAESAAADSARQPAAPAGQSAAGSAESAELEFWRSIMNSTNPADFEAYLEQFPNGVFRRLAEIRRPALRSPSGATGSSADVAAPAPAGSRGPAAVPGDDHGDSVNTATPIRSGSSTRGELEVAGDTDVFSIEVEATGTLTVETRGDMDAMGILTGDCGWEDGVRDDDGGDGLNFRIQEPVSPGRCFVEVSGFGDTVGRYVLHVSLEPGMSAGGYCGLSMDTPTYIIGHFKDTRGRDNYDRCTPSLTGVGTSTSIGYGCNPTDRDIFSEMPEIARTMGSPDGGAPYCTITYPVRGNRGNTFTYTFTIYRVAAQFVDGLAGRLDVGSEALERLQRLDVPFDADFRRCPPASRSTAQAGC